MSWRSLIVTLFILLGATTQALGFSQWKTPQGAAYCGLDDGEPPLSLVCWTPNDGYTIVVGPNQRSVTPRGRYVAVNVGYHEPVRTLGYGQHWRQATFHCVSRRGGLTCVNRFGHGFWLGRYHGVRRF